MVARASLIATPRRGSSLFRARRDRTVDVGVTLVDFVESVRAEKDVVLFGSCRRSQPRAADVVIEVSCVQKHFSHVRDFLNVPFRNTGSFELRGVQKHAKHSSDRRRVPFRNILVEGVRVTKHFLHIRHVTSIPIPDGFLEFKIRVEHSVHSRHAGDVPVFETFAFELGQETEHKRSICCIFHIPIAQIGIEER